MSRMASSLKHIPITLLLIWLSNNILFSQSIDYIDGKIINSATPGPVPFATIHLRNNQMGVYANAEGDFKIMRNPEFITDSVIITCIGFKRYSVAFKNLSDSIVNKIYLNPIIYSLGEVKVSSSARKLGSIAIIRRAIKNIPVNYPVEPFNYISYYRDYQKNGSSYINLNEAIVQTLDSGFVAKSISNKYRLLDFKKNLEFPRINITPYYESGTNQNTDNPTKIIPEARLGDQYGNELFVLMVHDPLRNFNTRSFSFIETFSKDFLTNHNFAEPVPVYDNNLLLFKIIFNGKSRVIGNLFRISGAIYIQPRTYSIHKIEYSCSYLTKGKTGGDMFNVDIEYGHENSADSLMRLKYISFNNYFKVENVDDSSYFRVLNAHWETKQFIHPTLIVNFNNKIDPVSAASKENYNVKVGKKAVKVSSVSAIEKTLYIRTKDDLTHMGDSSWIDIQNMKDTEGNILNHRNSMELYQYRELFVQEYNKPITFKDTCYMKYLPLDKNCKSTYIGNEKYWMNTPAIVKIKK
jgi:hypothetical protein